MIRSAIRSHFWPRYLTVALHRLLITARETLTTVRDYHQGDPAEYAQTVLGYYITFSGRPRFHGRVAEVGAGNSCEVAELLLASGAEHIDQVDRFFPGNGASRGIARHVAAAETFFDSHSGYDFILSTAVLEHLFDPMKALRSMAAALAPGGMVVHLVDLRDHDQFAPALHGLSFLRLPEWLYWPLGIHGGPNRYRASDYRAALCGLGLQFNLYTTMLAGDTQDFYTVPSCFNQLPADSVAQCRDYVRGIRPRLASRFHSISDEDLMTAGIAIVASKP